SKAAKSVVYIGDGSSKANAMVEEFAGLIDRLVGQHISVTSYGLGQQVDATLLAALANQTGGALMVDADVMADKQRAVTGHEAGQHLAQMAAAPVVWPTTLDVSKSLAEVYPKHTPPLRTDRDTILVGKLGEAGPVEVKLAGEVAAKPVSYTWAAEPRESKADNAYLTQLVNAGRTDGGYRLPTVGSEGLWEARRLVNLGAQSMARLSTAALAAGNKQQAGQLAEAALARDPENSNAQLIKQQLDGKAARSPDHAATASAAKQPELVAQAEPAPPPATAPVPVNPNELRLVAPEPATPPPPAAAPGQFLEDSDRIRQVLIGQIIADVNQQLRVNRDRIVNDPAGAKQDLELLMQRVIRAPELPAETRAQLRSQIEGVILLADTRQRERDVIVTEAAIRAAQAQENIRIQDNLVRSQLKIRQLLERMNSLISESRYAEAENDAALVALAEDPNNPVTVAAAINARFINYISLNNQFRDQTEKQFLATLHLVDESSIPFPDEPPIIYPSAERWRQLTKDREKYKSVDLKEPGSAEARINKALGEPTEMDFVDTPLKDVAEALQLRHGIPVQLDAKAITDAGGSLDMPITRQLKGVSLKSALRLTLAEHELSYIIDHEVLLITSAAAAKEHVVTKVYPVADLVLPVALPSGLNPFQSGGGLGGQGGFNSGQQSAVGGGGFGGGGFGGGGFGGGGGGGFGGGGGAFDVADPVDAKTSHADKAASGP
ncbi:MAG TPA: hypothetical protein VGH32_10120, partial [Pirellulales bacterium]